MLELHADIGQCRSTRGRFGYVRLSLYSCLVEQLRSLCQIGCGNTYANSTLMSVNCCWCIDNEHCDFLVRFTNVG
jgi:hypothetical protein